MAAIRNGVFNITSTIQVTPSVETYDVQGEFFDGSGLFDGTMFQVGDVIFDASLLGIFKWKIIQINSQDAASLDVRVSYDDEGSHPVPDVGPAAGSGAICGTAETGIAKVAQIPALSINEGFGMTEVLYTAIQNSNDRGTDIAAANISGGGPTSLEKEMENGHGSTISAGTPISKLSNGKIVPADSDAANGQKFCGITKESIPTSGTGLVFLPGPNIVGAVSGLGFAPGDKVYLGEDGGYVNSVTGFSGDNDSIWKIGMADCAEGSASTQASDLILMTELLITP